MHTLRHEDRAARLDLDGTWRFQLLRAPDAEPGPSWDEAQVPGCWTMQGFDDRPQYTNVQMPFPGLPPTVPEDNPTYEKFPFTVPSGDQNGSFTCWRTPPGQRTLYFTTSDPLPISVPVSVRESVLV